MAPPPATPTQPRIVVVDDSPAVCRSLSLMLGVKGFPVATIESGEALLQRPELQSADCFLIDLRMPGLDGVELLHRLRNQGIKAPAILISGDFASAVPEQAEAAGFASFLRKPMSIPALISAIATAIGGANLLST